MNGFRRFLNIIFAISGIVSLALLALTQYGPYTRIVAGWLQQDWLYMALQVLLAITALGLLVTLVRAIFSRKPQTSFTVTQHDGAEVTITRDAVASLATKIIESDGTCIAEDIDVTPKRGGVNVAVQVRPVTTLDVLDKSARLNEELRSGLAGLVGDKLKAVSLVFSEPETEHYVSAAQQQAFASYEPVASTETAVPAGDAAATEFVEVDATTVQTPVASAPEPEVEEM